MTLIALPIAVGMVAVSVTCSRHLWAARYIARGQHRTGVTVQRILTRARLARPSYRRHRYPIARTVML